MINLIGISILIIIEGIIIITIISHIKEKIEIKDNEIAERDHLLAKRTLIIKTKNQRIKELENEIKTRDNKRL